MVQNGTWKWLLQGFKFELETQGKPRTVEYYYEHARFSARWAQNQGLDDPYIITKRHLQTLLYQIARSSETWIGGNGAICKAQRSERTRWHYSISSTQLSNQRVETSSRPSLFDLCGCTKQAIVQWEAAAVIQSTSCLWHGLVGIESQPA